MRAFAAAVLLISCVAAGFVPASVRRRTADRRVSRAGASNHAELARDRRDDASLRLERDAAPHHAAPLALERDAAPHHAIHALDVDLSLVPAAQASPAAPIADDGDAVLIADDDDDTGLGVYWTPRLGLLGLAALCGTNFPLIHFLDAHFDDSTVAAVRFALATLPFAPRLASPKAREALGAGVETGLWGALGYATQAHGVGLTDASRGAFICALFMCVAPVYNTATGRRDVPARAWAAVTLALTGTALLTGLVDVEALQSAATAGGAAAGGAVAHGDGRGGLNAGDVWCLGGALGFGMMFVRMEARMDAHRDAVLEVTAWQLVTCTLVMGAWAAADATLGGGGGVALQVADAAAAATSSPPLALVAAALAWMGLMTTALVLWGQTAFMRTVPGHECALIFATEPVWAAGFAHLTLGESLGGAQLAGAALILAACVVNELRLPARPAAASEPLATR